METKEIFEKIREAKSLETELKGVKPTFGHPDFIKYIKIMRKLDNYCNHFGIEDLSQLYNQTKEKQSLVQSRSNFKIPNYFYSRPYSIF